MNAVFELTPDSRGRSWPRTPDRPVTGLCRALRPAIARRRLLVFFSSQRVSDARASCTELRSGMR
jgi:hypothetical protein